jgi:pteridine reductase
MKVAVHYNSSAQGATEAAAEIESSGGNAGIIKGDLAAADGPRQLIDSVIGQFGEIDVLVNTAAIMQRTPFGEITPAVWDSIMSLNFRAPFFLAQAAAPSLRKRRGAIVNIADLAAFETWPAYIPHGLSKSGVVQMTRSLARVLAPEVRVNGVAPGTVLLPEDWSKADEEHLRRTTPLGRTGSPADVVATVIFLLESDYITGETIVVDGGRRVRA